MSRFGEILARKFNIDTVYVSADYVDLSTALYAIGSNTATLLVDSPLPVTANVTVPSNVTLWFHGRGVLSINAGVTVTCNGKVVAARKLSDVVTGPGTFTLGATAEWVLPEPPVLAAGQLPPAARIGRLSLVTDSARGLWMDRGSQWASLTGVMNVRDFGAKGDGVTDDTAAIQAALDALQSGGTLLFPEGDYIITSTLTLTAVFSVRVIGSGYSHLMGTRFVWRGSPTGIAWDIQGVRDSYFGFFTVLSSTSFPFQIGIRISTYAGTVTTRNTFDHITIAGTNGEYQKGFVTHAGTGGDNNNDHHYFANVSVVNYGVAGYSFEHSQSKGHLLHTCNFVGAPGSSGPSYGIVTGLGPGFQGGSFTALNCMGGLNTGADFYMINPNDTISIFGGVFETSRRFLVTGGPSGDVCPVNVISARWAQDALHPDNRAIMFQWRGTFNLIGCIFEPADANRPLEIFFNPGANVGSFTAIGNYICSTLANPFTGIRPTAAFSNVINRNDGQNVVNLKVPVVGTYQGTTRTITSSYTVNQWNDEVILADATAGPLTITLPSASDAGVRLSIKKIDSSANAVTVSPASGQTIEGAASVSLTTQYAGVVLVAGGGGVWYKQ